MKFSKFTALAVLAVTVLAVSTHGRPESFEPASDSSWAQRQGSFDWLSNAFRSVHGRVNSYRHIDGGVFEWAKHKLGFGKSGGSNGSTTTTVVAPTTSKTSTAVAEGTTAVPKTTEAAPKTTEAAPKTTEAVPKLSDVLSAPAIPKPKTAPSFPKMTTAAEPETRPAAAEVDPEATGAREHDAEQEPDNDDGDDEDENEKSTQSTATAAADKAKRVVTDHKKVIDSTSIINDNKVREIADSENDDKSLSAEHEKMNQIAAADDDGNEDNEEDIDPRSKFH